MTIMKVIIELKITSEIPKNVIKITERLPIKRNRNPFINLLCLKNNIPKTGNNDKKRGI
jgi:hypothetical protein